MLKRLTILIASIAALVLSIGSATAVAAPQSTDILAVKVRKVAPTTWCIDGYYQGTYRGRGCFRNDGDHVTAYDGYVDGKHIRTDWYTDYGRDGACTDGGDAGGDDCNYNMRENGFLNFQVELRNGETLVAQTGWSGYLPIGQ